MDYNWHPSVFEGDPEKGVSVYPVKKMQIKIGGQKLPPRIYSLSLLRENKVYNHIVLGSRLEDAMLAAKNARVVIHKKEHPDQDLNLESFSVVSSSYMDISVIQPKVDPSVMKPDEKTEIKEALKEKIEETTPENKDYRKVIWLRAVKAEDAIDDHERRVIQAIINRLERTESVKPQGHEAKN